MRDLGSQTEISTLKRQASLCPLILGHGSLEYSLQIPTFLYSKAYQMKSSFIATLEQPTDGLAQDDNPFSTVELVARFLGFCAKETSNHEDSNISEKVVEHVLDHFERAFLHDNDVHALSATLEGVVEKRLIVVRAYYAACAVAKRPVKIHDSALFRKASDGKVHIYAVFGGQGNTEKYFDELREIYITYPTFIREFVVSAVAHLQALSRDSRARKLYYGGFDVMKWLNDRESQPDTDYLISAPVSVPLIGLSQLAQYIISCKALGLHPGQLREKFSGITGHSQGLIIATVVSASKDWNTFDHASKDALTVLFWIGLRSQQVYPRASLSPYTLQDSINNGEGKPTPMLSIRDLTRKDIQGHIDAINKLLPSNQHVAICLVNSSRNLVVTGPPMSLYSLNLRLRENNATENLSQNRIPSSKRKPWFVHRFLPITVPFHSHYLIEASRIIEEDLKHIVISSSSLGIPTFDTSSGKNLQEADCSNIVATLVRMVTYEPLNWEQATKFPNATHILDFGPGGTHGVGALTNRNKDGTGVRIILAGSMAGSNTEVGYKSEIFDRDIEYGVKYSVNWFKTYGPKLIKNSVGELFVDTKMSRILGLPPIIIAGMTPTTAAWDFVAATANAGYEIELAGGGYYNEKDMIEAIDRIVRAIPAGRGISINLIYANPRAMQWQIPMIAKLCGSGILIEGLTIGAGVPSIEVAQEYIRTLGIKRIAFKPGSTDAIQQVINIAKANPFFPVVLQWTGGRGGGHHSFEDFHQPILAMYSKIRRCNNLIVVAGSGFGGAEDTYPYLTGEWSKKYGYPPMPFDGLLLGSRVMTAKEARTSPPAKQAIVDTEGVDDADWEKTYSGPAGGVVTVQSEMGEPIHKLATRGVIFWAEMDKKIFSLDKTKRMHELKRNREYIIKKLNADFQKVWFGRNRDGKPVDIEDMTYGEVVRRMVDLMYLKRQKRWIDKTLATLTLDFMHRVEERFNVTGGACLIQCVRELDKPYLTMQKFFTRYAEADIQPISAQDVQYFIHLCQRKDQKPVPFIPALDDSFEFFFKRDSLWQSEDIDSVVDQDVGRVCILHGPVAARFSTVINQPVKEILDSVHNNHIKYLIKDTYGSSNLKIPIVEYFDRGISKEVKIDVEGLEVFEGANKTTYRLTANGPLPDVSTWMSILGGKDYSWRRAFFTTSVFIQGETLQTNPMQRILAPTLGMLVEIENPNNPSKTLIIVKEERNDGQLMKSMELGMKGQEIILNMFEERTVEHRVITLLLRFTYHPETGYAPIHEIMEGRNDRIKEFYYRVWFGAEQYPFEASLNSKFEGGRTTLTSEAVGDFVHAFGNTSEIINHLSGHNSVVPMDFAFVVMWKAIIKPVFLRIIDGDLLTLCHLSNTFRILPGAEPLRKGDVLDTTATLNAVINQETGKMVEVVGTINRDGHAVMAVATQFLFRGSYNDFENTFQRKIEAPMRLHLTTAKDVAVLKSKAWFKLENLDIALLNKTLDFNLESFVRFKSKTLFSVIETRGRVTLKLSNTEVVQIASVDCVAHACRRSPVIDYLERNASAIECPVNFETPICLNDKESLSIKAPTSNETYACASGDYNPIHVSRMFASYANLPGTITHGMYSSTVVRCLVETWAAEHNVGRMTSFHVNFVGMVLPDDIIEVNLQHVGMISGRKIIKIEASKNNAKDKVLIGEAEVEQPSTAYVFTGQGSQKQGMGMDLYKSSPIAREIWDRADRYLLENYGFAITSIVQNNPKEIIIHFGGSRGKNIRQNYMSMTFDTVGADGCIRLERIFKDIDEKTVSYTYHSPAGLLAATCFAQPALTLTEMASFEDMRSKGLIQHNCSFAGHSLGEYSALATLAGVMTVESLLSIVFYRGLTMQAAVGRGAEGRSNYTMCAVNPSKVSQNFNEQALQFVVQSISKQTNWLLEIVNYNVHNLQYVCAGDTRALDCLANFLDYLKNQNIDFKTLMDILSPENVDAKISGIIWESVKQTDAKPKPLELQPGCATIPLRGIDVPFHSTFLRSGVNSFRTFLLKRIDKTAIDPSKLIDRYLPNLTARPFEITREYFEDVYNLTKSPKIGNILADWKLCGEAEKTRGVARVT